MGQRWTYQCKKCGYSTLVSGGQDVGMMIKTDTFICLKCKEVVDVVIEYRTGEKFKKLNAGKCPLCHSKKHLVKWDTQLRPCPKCGGKLEKTSGTHLLWD